MIGPRLETGRLVLRPTALEDFPRWAEMMADPETAKYIGGPQPEATAWRGFMTMAGAWSLVGVAMFSVIERSTGRWLGRIGPWKPSGWPGPEVGWALHPDAQGKGFAQEAAIAAMDHAFGTLGWTRVVHSIDQGNEASKRLAARLGSNFMRMSDLPPPFDATKAELWGQSAASWAETRSRLTTSTSSPAILSNNRPLPDQREDPR